MSLEIKNLHAKIDNKILLNNINLKMNSGEIHAIMGPNGSGKSSLSNIICGHPNYKIKGRIFLNGKNISDLNIFERARMGIFLNFQYPIEIPGVSNIKFIQSAVNSIRKSNNQDRLDAKSFMKKLNHNMQLLQIDPSYIKRGVNANFSGGEKKRNEMLQMMMLEPKVCILDEIDSGLDIDALKIVAKAANHMRSNNRIFIIITHYQRLLNYIIPDFVHVLMDGNIIKSGDKDLALALENKGYSWIKN